MTIMGFKPRNHPQQIAKHGGPCDETDDRRTPPEIYQPQDAIHRFTLDAAASAENAKCARFYTISDSGLTKSWAGERVWCNPPFSNCAAWVAKAWTEMRDGCHRVVMLLPANRTEQRWWQQLVEPYRDKPAREGVRLTVTFLSGRPRFIRPDFIAPAKGDRPPFGCCVLTFTRADESTEAA
jgi:phage N-6-adenine-methyltransferase